MLNISSMSIIIRQLYKIHFISFLYSKFRFTLRLLNVIDVKSTFRSWTEDFVTNFLPTTTILHPTVNYYCERSKANFERLLAAALTTEKINPPKYQSVWRPWWQKRLLLKLSILGSHSRDQTAMLVNKMSLKFCKITELKSQNTFFAIVLYTNMAAVTSGENRALGRSTAVKLGILQIRLILLNVKMHHRS